MREPMMMVVKMVMMSSEQKPPSLSTSQDDAPTVIETFTEITLSNCDNDLRLVGVTSVRLNGRMLEIPVVEIWRTGLLWVFFLPLFFFSLYFSTSLDLGPVQMPPAWVFTTYSDNPSGLGVSHCAGSAKWPQHITNQFWDWLVSTFVYVERLYVWFESILLLDGFMLPTGSAPTEGDNVMAGLHVMCLVQGNTHFIHSRLATSLRSLAKILRYFSLTTLHYSAPLTSTFATISTDTPSYVAIHRRMCLHT